MAKLIEVGNLNKVIVTDDGDNMQGKYRGELGDLTLALILYKIIDGMSRVENFMQGDDKDTARGIWVDLRDCLNEDKHSHQFTGAEVDLLSRSCKATPAIGLCELDQILEELEVAESMTGKKPKERAA